MQQEPTLVGPMVQHSSCQKNCQFYSLMLLFLPQEQSQGSQLPPPEHVLTDTTTLHSFQQASSHIIWLRCILNISTYKKCYNDYAERVDYTVRVHSTEQGLTVAPRR